VWIFISDKKRQAEFKDTLPTEYLHGVEYEVYKVKVCVCVCNMCVYTVLSLKCTKSRCVCVCVICMYTNACVSYNISIWCV
jgi:hypothetical protein